MALKIRKDIKKSSYYVWFLGAKESKGIRGKEYILPVIEHLVQREKEIEPFKVTLQVSHKGLKIIQTVLSTNPKSNKPKNETIKHFIPQNTISFVYQEEDIVSCILLLFNPVTKCPLHIHVYRCDSVETATLLKTQLETLIDRPENQKKITELESKISNRIPKEKKKFNSSLGSETGTSTRESESSEERFSPSENNRVTSLYDSLAAELRQKLNKTESPILLPPRDYDTVHRQKGNLQNIDLRRCLNTSIVGQNMAKNVVGKRIESSGGSSGIGSDHAPSPDSPDSPERFNNLLDNQSTSDEEWNIEPSEATHYLLHGGQDMILPRASRHPETSKFSPEPPKSPQEYSSRFSRYPNLEKSLERPRYDRFDSNEKSSADSWRNDHEKFYQQQQKYQENEENRRLQRYDSGFKESPKHLRSNSKGYRDDFEDDFEKDYIRKEKEEIVPRPRSKYIPEDSRFYQEEKGLRKYSDEFYQKDSNPRYYEEEREVIRTRYPPNDPRFYSSDHEEKRNEKDFYRNSQKYQDDSRYYEKEKVTKKFNPEDPRFYTDTRISEKSSRSKYSQEEIPSSPRVPKYKEDYFEEVPDIRRRPEDRQRPQTPPEENVSPKERFKDAKEKFLLMERERLEEERLRRQEMMNPSNKDKTFLKRHESMIVPKERYIEDRRFEMEQRYQPKPAPRTILEDEVRYRREIPDRYRTPEERFEPRDRRSMYAKIEDEHKRSSNEIARELKRRSYMEEKYELPENRRYPGLDRDRDREPYNFSKSNVELDKVAEKYSQKYEPKPQRLKQPAGYRHSYAEPKLANLEKVKKGHHYPEMVHRTNSSVSREGRVGIASVNPY